METKLEDVKSKLNDMLISHNTTLGENLDLL